MAAVEVKLPLTEAEPDVEGAGGSGEEDMEVGDNTEPEGVVLDDNNDDEDDDGDEDNLLNADSFQVIDEAGSDQDMEGGEVDKAEEETAKKEKEAEKEKPSDHTDRLMRTSRWMGRILHRSLVIKPVTGEDIEGPILGPYAKMCPFFCIKFVGKKGKKKEGVMEMRFSSEEDMEKAFVKLSGAELSPNRVAITEKITNVSERFTQAVTDAREKIMNADLEEPTSVFVNNIPANGQEEMLKFLYPSARSVMLPKDGQGRVQGYAIVEFRSLAEARAVVQNNQEYRAKIGENYLILHVVGHEDDQGPEKGQESEAANRDSRARQSPERQRSKSTDNSRKSESNKARTPSQQRTRSADPSKGSKDQPATTDNKKNVSQNRSQGNRNKSGDRGPQSQGNANKPANQGSQNQGNRGTPANRGAQNRGNKNATQNQGNRNVPANRNTPSQGNKNTVANRGSQNQGNKNSAANRGSQNQSQRNQSANRGTQSQGNRNVAANRSSQNQGNRNAAANRSSQNQGNRNAAANRSSQNQGNRNAAANPGARNQSANRGPGTPNQGNQQNQNKKRKQSGNPGVQYQNNRDQGNQAGNRGRTGGMSGTNQRAGMKRDLSGGRGAAPMPQRKRGRVDERQRQGGQFGDRLPRGAQSYPGLGPAGLVGLGGLMPMDLELQRQLLLSQELALAGLGTGGLIGGLPPPTASPLALPGLHDEMRGNFRGEDERRERRRSGDEYRGAERRSLEDQRSRRSLGDDEFRRPLGDDFRRPLRDDTRRSLGDDGFRRSREDQHLMMEQDETLRRSLGDDSLGRMDRDPFNNGREPYPPMDSGLLHDSSRYQDRGLPLDPLRMGDRGLPLEDARLLGLRLPSLDTPSSRLADLGLSMTMDALRRVDRGLPLDTSRMANVGLQLDMARSRGGNSIDSAANERNRELYIGNFPRNATIKETKDFFKDKLMQMGFCNASDTPVVKVKKKHGRGFQFVLFKKELFARAALSDINGAVFKGSKLKIQKSQ